MKWGNNDCFIELFGENAHKNISWIKQSHNETVGWLMSLPKDDRKLIMCSTFEGQGWVKVDKVKPGDCAIGHFKMGVIQDLELPDPWYARYGHDHHFYIRMVNCKRVAEYIGEIVVYRKWQSLR